MINSLPPPYTNLDRSMWLPMGLLTPVFSYFSLYSKDPPQKKKTDFKKLIEIAQYISRHYSSCLIIQNCPPPFFFKYISINFKKYFVHQQYKTRADKACVRQSSVPPSLIPLVQPLCQIQNLGCPKHGFALAFLVRLVKQANCYLFLSLVCDHMFGVQELQSDEKFFDCFDQSKFLISSCFQIMKILRLFLYQMIIIGNC